MAKTREGPIVGPLGRRFLASIHASLVCERGDAEPRFSRRGPSSKRQNEGTFNPGSLIGARPDLIPYAFRKIRGMILDEFAVESRQRLKRRGRDGPPGAVERHDREIKNVKQADRVIPPGEEIEAASIGRGRVLGRDQHQSVGARDQRRRPSAEPANQPAAYREHGIAQCLGLETAERHAAQELIRWIEGLRWRSLGHTGRVDLWRYTADVMTIL